MLPFLSKTLDVFTRTLIRTGLYSKPSLYYTSRQLEEWRDFYQKLRNKTPLVIKTSQYSADIYEAYGIRDIQDYFEGNDLCLFRGKLITMSHFDMRQEYLKYLYKEIDKVIECHDEKEVIKILEIGCGNCINLVNLQKKYGTKVSLSGQDIAKNRIENAKQYFGDELSTIRFQVQNIIDGYDSPDNSFHIIFSMHCLEQIPYDCKSAILEMYRLASEVVIMIEPVFELGNITQRLYLTNSDHNRVLLTTIKDLDLPIGILEVLDIQSNPCNQSSLIVVKKQLCNV